MASCRFGDRGGGWPSGGVRRPAVPSMEGLSEQIFRFVTARSPKFETPAGKPLATGDSYKPKETALCETGYFFFGNTGPSERSALILSGIGGACSLDSGTRLFCTRPSAVSDRAPVGCPGRRGTRSDELKPVGKAVRSFLFRGSSAGTYSRSEENVVGRIFIRRRRGLVFFVCAEPSFLLGKSGERGCVSCVSALRTAVRVTGLTSAIRYRPVGGGVPDGVCRSFTTCRIRCRKRGERSLFSVVRTEADTSGGRQAARWSRRRFATTCARFFSGSSAEAVRSAPVRRRRSSSGRSPGACRSLCATAPGLESEERPTVARSADRTKWNDRTRFGIRPPFARQIRTAELRRFCCSKHTCRSSRGMAHFSFLCSSVVPVHPRHRTVRILQEVASIFPFCLFIRILYGPIATAIPSPRCAPAGSGVCRRRLRRAGHRRASRRAVPPRRTDRKRPDGKS